MSLQEILRKKKVSVMDRCCNIESCFKSCEEESEHFRSLK